MLLVQHQLQNMETPSCFCFYGGVDPLRRPSNKGQILLSFPRHPGQRGYCCLVFKLIPLQVNLEGIWIFFVTATRAQKESHTIPPEGGQIFIVACCVCVMILKIKNSRGELGFV